MDFQLPFNLYIHKYKYQYAAMYHALKDTILQGKIPQGSKLPSSRDLAAMYSVSRGTVYQVYDMLASEGYVESKVGKGTFVSYEHVFTASIQNMGSANIVLSDWGDRINQWPMRKRDADEATIVDFSTYGDIDPAHFPYGEWNRCMYAEVRRHLSAQFRSEAFAVQGHLPLREAIAYHLKRRRGIEAGADEIVIVNGSMQAIALLCQLLVNSGDRVMIENPSYLGIRKAIRAAGGVPLSNELDENGVVFRPGPARLLFVTPSRQFPTGVVLSLERRQQILKWAQETAAMVIEDDYDSEFRRKGRPIEPLKILDQQGRVIYIGTFSKTMPSDLRLGYVVLPPKFIAPFCKAKQLFEPHPTSLLQQKALAAFMRSGQYERHLRRMERVYKRKHDRLFEQLTRLLGNYFEFSEPDLGLHIFGRWKGTVESFKNFKASCQRAGVCWADVTGLYLTAPIPSACFGFSHLNEQEIIDGVSRMAELLR